MGKTPLNHPKSDNFACVSDNRRLKYYDIHLTSNPVSSAAYIIVRCPTKKVNPTQVMASPIFLGVKIPLYGLFFQQVHRLCSVKPKTCHSMYLGEKTYTNLVTKRTGEDMLSGITKTVGGFNLPGQMT